MASKKRRWRETDDPDEIFGADRHADFDSEALALDPHYDSFRRHIDENIQGETRAFHELRSTAEHELQAAAVVTSTPKKPPSVKKAKQEPLPEALALSPAALQPIRPAKNKDLSNLIMMGLISAAIGFLLNSVFQQIQGQNRLKSNSSRARAAAADPNCVTEKVAAKKISPSPSPKTAKLPIQAIPVPTIVDETPVAATAPAAEPIASASSTSLDAIAPTEPKVKAMTLRPIELRRGPGASFDIVDSLPPGFAVEGTMTTDRQWLRVKPGSFVSVDALQMQVNAEPAGYQSYWVGSHIANIREFPLTTARIVRKADPRSELKLQHFNSEWAQLEGGGFVFKKLVTDQAPLLMRLPALMRVAVEKAEIRSGPGLQFPILGIYFRNHKVEAQEALGDWLRVGPEQFVKAQEMELSAIPNSGKTM
jgi:hypothetical protein